MEITIEGAEELINELEILADCEGIEEQLAQACELVKAEAFHKAPKDSGALRRSIQYKVEEKEEGLVGTIYTPLEYAPYIEYGTGLFAEAGDGRKDSWRYQDDSGEWHTTSGMKPQPFLRPALLENQEKVVQILQEGLIND